MELDILTNGEIADSVCVKTGNLCDLAQLEGGHLAVGNPDADHEALQGAPFAVLAASDAGSIALRINAPPAEVGSDPFGRDRVEALASEAADLLQAFPRIERALQALHSLS